MKPIKITKNLRQALKDYSDVNTNYDGIINRLIYDVSDEMPIIEDDYSSLNISIHEDTMDKLKAFRLSRGESYENILIRMLLLAKDLNNNKE